MPLRKVSGPVLSIEECKAAALTYLAKQDPHCLTRPSAIAVAIWPENRMSAQGAGLAGARILAKMKAEGTARWAWETRGGTEWDGWVITFSWALTNCF